MVDCETCCAPRHKNAETDKVRTRKKSAIIAVDVRRFGHAINTDKVFSTHSRVEPALDRIIDQRLDGRGVFGRSLGKRSLQPGSAFRPSECHRSGSPAKRPERSDAIQSFLRADDSATKRAGGGR